MLFWFLEILIDHQFSSESARDIGRTPPHDPKELWQHSIAQQWEWEVRRLAGDRGCFQDAGHSVQKLGKSQANQDELFPRRHRPRPDNAEREVGLCSRCTYNEIQSPGHGLEGSAKSNLCSAAQLLSHWWTPPKLISHGPFVSSFSSVPTLFLSQNFPLAYPLPGVFRDSNFPTAGFSLSFEFYLRWPLSN